MEVSALVADNSSDNNRNRGRSARKRRLRQANREAESDVTAEQFRRQLQKLTPEEAATKARAILTAAQQDVLRKYTTELQRSSSSLTTESGAWAFLHEHLPEARRLGLEVQLRQLVWEAAAKFANPKMLRVTQRYGK